MARLTVEFPDRVNTMLEKLSVKEDTSKVEVLRRALALYDYVHTEAFDVGKKLTIVGAPTDPVKEIVLGR